MENSRLRAELARVTMERDILENHGVFCEVPEMKYALYSTPQASLAISVQCRVLRVSVSGYHEHLARRVEIARRRHLSDEALLVHISAVYAENPRRVWMARIWRRTAGTRHSRGQAAGAAADAEARHPGARGKRRFRVATTDSRHNLPIAQRAGSQIHRGPRPTGWVGDLTYIATEQGWLFFGCSDRSVQPQSSGLVDAARHAAHPWVIDALEMAWFKRNPGKHAELIFHSDRGSQYASDDFSEVLKEHGITPSMSRKGNCWDNACSETLFRFTEGGTTACQRFETIREAKDEVISWLLWYNQTRMHSTLNYVSPTQFEQDWTDATMKIAA